jgi:DNA modification methylase
MKQLADYEYYRTNLGVLYCGDCLEILPLMTKYDSLNNYKKTYDLIITDPPYGINIANNPFRQKFVKENWDLIIPDEKIFQLGFNISKNAIVFGGNYFSWLWRSHFRGFCFWNKHTHNKNIGAGELIWTSFDIPCKNYDYVWDGNKYGFLGKIKGVGKPTKKYHPTEKPVELITWILSDFAQPKQNILDMFFGSGSTGVSCEKNGYFYTGIEINERYCAIAKKRIMQEANQLKLFK